MPWRRFTCRTTLAVHAPSGARTRHETCSLALVGIAFEMGGMLAHATHTRPADLGELSRLGSNSSTYHGGFDIVSSRRCTAHSHGKYFLLLDVCVCVCVCWGGGGVCLHVCVCRTSVVRVCPCRHANICVHVCAHATGVVCECACVHAHLIGACRLLFLGVFACAFHTLCIKTWYESRC